MLNFGKGMPWSEERDGVQKAFIAGDESGMGRYSWKRKEHKSNLMVTRGIDLLGVKDAAEPLGTWLMV